MSGACLDLQLGRSISGGKFSRSITRSHAGQKFSALPNNNQLVQELPSSSAPDNEPKTRGRTQVDLAKMAIARPWLFENSIVETMVV